MKIFSKNTDLWNKSNHLKLLFEKKIKIPNTFIVWNDNFNLDDFSFIDQKKDYILRPSFSLEDSKDKSFAWFFKSIFPIKKDGVIKAFREKRFDEIFNWKWYELQSIIIQEFIETNNYWVYFSRNPNNIFKKWFYEIWENNNWITWWLAPSLKKLSFVEKKELEIIWNKLEKLFNFPQDIEFCIKDEDVIILQTRPITTWNNTIYSLNEIKKINWLYKYLDFDEIWNNSDFFSYSVLSWLFKCIFIENKIYFKLSFPPFFLFNKAKKDNTNLYNFYKNYKKYLILKYLFLFLKFITFQKLDNKVITDFFKKYHYSFLLDKKSNLYLNFDYETNFITTYFLKLEKIKNKSFYFYENYKNDYKWENFLIDKSSLDLPNMIFINWWLVLWSKDDDNYIYRWEINWIITDINTYDKNKKNQVLIWENLDFNLYDKLNNLNWIIIKNGNKLSHNSIILRENKIPSIIKYKDYDKLFIWEKIIIKI